MVFSLALKHILVKHDSFCHEGGNISYRRLAFVATLDEKGYNTTGLSLEAWPVRLAARTLPSHGGNRGSIPLQATNAALMPAAGGTAFFPYK
jgi:hypothetical protein